jgi:alpha-D-xyloside xylohydrolase
MTAISVIAASPIFAAGNWNGCQLALEKLVLTTDPSTSNIVLSPQSRRNGDPWVPRAKYVSGHGRLVVEVLNDDIMRFEWSPNQGLPPDKEPIYSSPMVSQKVHEGASRLDVREKGTVLETPTLKVTVDPNSLHFTVFDKRKNQTLATIGPEVLHEPYKKFHIDNTGIHDPDIEGIAAKPRNASSIDSGWKGQNALAPNPYGNGMNRFDYEAAPTYNQMPVAFFHNGKNNYGLFVDNPLKTEWFFGGKNHGTVGMWGDHPRMYLIAGENNPDIHNKFMKIQGMPKLPRDSALGWQMSEFGYRNWMEMFDKLRATENAGMPLPRTIGLDLQWYGEMFGNPYAWPPSRMGTFTWDDAPDKFPRAGEVIKWLKDRGIELVPIFEAYIDRNSPHWQKMVDSGFLVKNEHKNGPAYLNPKPGGFWRWEGGYLDASNPDARAFYFDTFMLPLARQGNHNFWLDLTDPELYDVSGKYSNRDGQGENHADNHNLYGNYFSQMVEEGYRRHGINERPVTISRAMTIGPKGMNWSGDINNSPDSLKAHLREALDASWAGQFYLGSDGGGFWRRWPDWRYGQLYTRWLAAATQTAEVPTKVHVFNLEKNQPYLPSEVGEFDSNKANLQEHSALEPYRKSLAYDAHLNGAPLRSSPSFYNQADWGLKGWSEMVVGRNDFLIAPSIDIDENFRNVRLPSGNKWVNYETHELHDGGQVLHNVPSRDKQGRFRHPQFARAGAIFPRSEQQRASIQHGAQHIPPKNHDLVLRVFPNTDQSAFKLFEDDGHSREHEWGQVRSTHITQKQEGNTVNVRIEPSQGSYNGAPGERRHKIELATTNMNVEKVHINGHELHRSHDKNDFLNNWMEGYYVDHQAKMVIVKTGPMNVTWNKHFAIQFK